MADKPLSAPLNLHFDYTRSTGPTIGAFVTALRDRKVIGARGSNGRVFVPPPEFDPDTAEPLTDFVGVSDGGTVVSWTWMPEPIEGQPLTKPFAWALIKLDGADTSMLHAVDVDSPTTSAPACGFVLAGRRSGSGRSRTSSASNQVRAKTASRQSIPAPILSP
ncbi:hypothetical protein GCM10020255_052080 [Rhodococcus baikonurensis]